MLLLIVDDDFGVGIQDGRSSCRTAPLTRATAPTEASPAALFDEAALLARSDGDREFALELIAAFAEAAQEQLATIESALVLGDVQAVRAQAHTLKGASSTVAANAIASTAAALEKANSEQLLPGADRPLVATVHQTLQQWRMQGWLGDKSRLSAGFSGP